MPKKNQINSHSTCSNKHGKKLQDGKITALQQNFIPLNHAENSLFVKDIDVELAKEFVDENEK